MCCFQMKEILQCLPASLSELIQYSLIRLQSQYRGTGLDWTLAALTVSSTGMTDHHHLLMNGLQISHLSFGFSIKCD